MKSTMVGAVLACCAITLLGCVSGPVGMGPSGIGPGMLLTNVTYPSDNSSTTQYQLRGDDFEILGPVRGEGASHSILGLVSVGDSGYGKALQDAQRQGADDIANMRHDTRFFNFLYLYTRVDTIVTGTGVKWKNTAR